jgi:5'-3' exoribonuclease 2
MLLICVLQGTPSWSWFYPFHYAPCASDLANTNISAEQLVFEMSEPFSPVEQLLAVLPKDSVHALPAACQYLMTDPTSPLADIYENSNIVMDHNGASMSWLWVSLLPFIDEARIKAAMKLCIPNLTAIEEKRNRFGYSVLFRYSTSSSNEESEVDVPLRASFGVYGKVRSLEDETVIPFSEQVYCNADTASDIQQTYNTVVYHYELPNISPHESKLLPNFKPIAKILTPQDLNEIYVHKQSRGYNINIVDVYESMNHSR